MARRPTIGEIILLAIMGLFFIGVIYFFIRKVSHSETRGLSDILPLFALAFLAATIYLIFFNYSFIGIIISAVIFFLFAIGYMIYSGNAIRKAGDLSDNDTDYESLHAESDPVVVSAGSGYTTIVQNPRLPKYD